MKIIKSMEDILKYLSEVFDGNFSDELSFKLCDFIIFENGSNYIFKNALIELGQKQLDIKKAAEFSECIFQLQNYKKTLKNYIEFLLTLKHFEHICAFVNMLFVGNVGDYKYRGIAKSYTIEERYFDRFAEIIHYCEIERQLLLPFFLKIFASDANSRLFYFKEPLKEYLKIFAKNKEDDLFKLFTVNKNLDGIEYFLSANTNRTLTTLIDSFVKGENNYAAEIKNLIVKYKTESFNILEARINSNDPEVAYRAIVLLCAYKGDFQADNCLLALYNKTKNNKIKTFIAKELGFESFKKFGTDFAFNSEVNKKVKAVQERLYGLRLKRFYEAHDIGKTEEERRIITYTFDTFKTLEKDSILKFVNESLNKVDEKTKLALANIVFDMSVERQTLASSKWAMRLIACFADEELSNKVAEVIIGFYLKNKSAAEYFLQCFAMCANVQFINILKQLNRCNFNEKTQKYFVKMTKLYAGTLNVPVQLAEDLLVDDYGLNEKCERVFDLGKRKIKIVVSDDLQVLLFNFKTGRLGRLSDEDANKHIKNYVHKLEREISRQSKRFYHTFLECRRYSKETFSEVFSNPLLTKIAGSVLWGKYKNDRLYETFKLNKSEKVHISGTYMLEKENYDIALIHPLDIADNVNKIEEDAGRLIFNQLRFPKFSRTEYHQNAVWVDSFAGIFANAHMFITRLQKLTYKINDLNKQMQYTTMTKANVNLNLLTEVEFDSIKLGAEKNYTTTISKIRFYKLDSLIKDGKNYILNRSEALSLYSLNERIFSNELALIFLACSR